MTEIKPWIIVRFVNLVNKSNLYITGYKYYDFLIDHAMRDSMNPRCFYDDESFLKAVEIILRSSIQDDSKYVSITSLILYLKKKDVDNNLQNKSNIVLYAMLISGEVIHTYLAPHVLYIKRPNDKRSDVKMSDYLSDDQMIKEDILWLKNKDLKKFKEFCGEINNIQGIEVKETFENYLNEINSKKKHSALKCAVVALATICVVTGIIAIARKSTIVGAISAAAGVIAIVLSGYLLYSSKLECVNITCANKDTLYLKGS